MSEFLKAEGAARLIERTTALRPRIGVVLGSGLSAFSDSLQESTRIPYASIPQFPVSTAIGHRGELVIGRAGGVPVAVLSGRAHLYEGYTANQVALPARILGRFGVDTLVLTNAAGAIRESLRPGDLMVVDDHINFMGGSPLVGPNDPRLGERFFDMSEAYDPALRALAKEACTSAGLRAQSGVYIGFRGPSYETPAEIRMARTLGADAVGMSTIPEVLAARHMGIRVLAISCITNMAAGILAQKLDHQEVLRVGESTRTTLVDVLGRVVLGLAHP
jgi:purine-nucleoside phosphorylase